MNRVPFFENLKMKKVLTFRFDLFEKGEKNLKHKKRSVELNTATIDDNISKIQAFIKSNQYCTLYDEIKAEFQISRDFSKNVKTFKESKFLNECCLD